MAHLTQSERERYTKLFLRVDTNGDGWLNLTELSVLCEVLGYKLDQSKIQSLFTSLDTDKNLKVTLDEFLAAMPKIEPKERKCANLRRLFTLADTNKDGLLSADELSRILTTGDTPLAEDKAKRLIARVDKDGDHQLDYEEFLKLIALMY
ncbi:calmodulin-4-like [Haliotis rufescens]|uniref:calmodulin-4-like n=1 Tax=Haliotis rufescens TaxID=6454 RepID=UPI00201EA7C1|nr:calmodulin-4-like [Haliotis rufescens]